MILEGLLAVHLWSISNFTSSLNEAFFSRNDGTQHYQYTVEVIQECFNSVFL